MPEARDPQSLIAAAEQAAAAGDYVSAERLLREAAALQEASLGPLHADLANTLNNLGVVCEITDNPVDAEHYFRRACAIATAILAPDHPFVATSRKNLEDFCAARGKAVKLPGAVSLVTARDPVPLTGPQTAPPERRTIDEPSMPDVRERRTARGLVAALVVAGLLLAIAAMWLRPRDGSESNVIVAPTPANPRAAAPESASVETMPSEEMPSETMPSETMPSEAPRDAIAPGSAARPAEPQKPPATASTTGLTTDAERQAAAPSSAPRPVVALAQVCRSLSTRGRGGWQCERPEGPVSPGPVFFYTRIKTPAAVSVQHRWYRGDRVHRVVELRVGANALDGYRTYSRTTIDAREQGDWRVELTTRDGAVLHEERFVVR